MGDSASSNSHLQVTKDEQQTPVRSRAVRSQCRLYRKHSGSAQKGITKAWRSCKVAAHRPRQPSKQRSPEALGQRVLAGCRQHAHELVEGAEGPPYAEADVQAGQVDQVAGKRRIMVRVEPAAEFTSSPVDVGMSTDFIARMYRMYRWHQG
eukprot:GHRQ01038864.1.p1 GENE.GHRQ01038864.1~~GHRQ01038864.1.p1  ORF type:complete len:151 (-),score=15.21 GHRQ01038864.1:240-692(-)